MASSDKPGMFVACGHASPPEPIPDPENKTHVFQKDTAVYTQPALCMECHIKHTKNRQQFIVDTYRSRLMAAENKVIEQFLKIESTKVRNELMQTGKRVATEDLNLQRNAEIVSLWLTFSEAWSFASRFRWIEVRTGPYRTEKTKQSQYLTLVVDRNANEISVTGTWKIRNDNKVVETVEIMKW